MNVSRLKNIILLMLLAANLVLAAVLGLRSFEAWRADGQALDRAVDALAELGASAERELLAAEPAPLYRAEMERDLEAETLLAERFIGASESVRDASGVYRLSGANGSAVLSNVGRIELALDTPLLCADAETFLALAGLDASEFVVSEDGSTLTQLVGGASVLGRELTLGIEDGRLVSVSGTLLLGDDYIIDAAPSKSLSAALLSLAAELHDASQPAGRILAAEPGYAASPAAPGYVLLEPMWRIETENAGVWYVDALTLEASRQVG